MYECPRCHKPGIPGWRRWSSSPRRAHSMSSVWRPRDRSVEVNGLSSSVSCRYPSAFATDPFLLAARHSGWLAPLQCSWFMRGRLHWFQNDGAAQPALAAGTPASALRGEGGYVHHPAMVVTPASRPACR